MSIVKALTSPNAVPEAGVAVGTLLEYSVTVSNVGDTTLTGLAVTDSRAGVSVDCGGVTSLAPGVEVVCDAAYRVTQGDVDAGGPILNRATVDAAQVEPVTSNQVSVPVVAARPGLSVVKTPDPVNVVAAPGTVTYTVLVTNSGNVTLSNVRVTEPLVGLSALSCTPAQGSALAPNATMTCTASLPVDQARFDAGTPIVNTATATGQPAQGGPVDRLRRRRGDVRPGAGGVDRQGVDVAGCGA